MIPFKQILTNADDIILVTKAQPIDLPGPEIVYANEAVTRLTEYSLEEVIGKTPRILQGKDTDRRTLDEVRKALAKLQNIRFEILNYSKSGVPYWLDCNVVALASDNGEIEHFAAIERDLTEYKRVEERLRKLASNDPLTGLLNRRVFMDYANIASKNLSKHNIPYAIAVIDLDNFTSLNDTHGQAFGDEVLKRFVYLLRNSIRANDAIGRLNGDTFIFCFNNVSEENTKSICNKIFNSFESALVINGIEISISASMGVYIPSRKDTNLENVLGQADKALYHAKHSGKHCYKIYTPEYEAKK